MQFAFSKEVRTVHYWAAVLISLPLLVVIATGIFLQVRKYVDWIQPTEKSGIAANNPAASLEAILDAARSVAAINIRGWNDVQLVDLRPGNGSVKVRNHDEVEVQLDATTGAVLHTGKRLNDIVVLMHEGTTWGARLWLFLPVGIATFGLWCAGFYLVVVTTGPRWRRWRAARARSAAIAAAVILAPAEKPATVARHFNFEMFLRKYHYWFALIVLAPWFVVIVSGLVLQVRYEVPWVLPPLQQGSRGDPTLEFGEALKAAQKIPDIGVSNWKDVWRIYVYPRDGVVQVRAKNNWEVQLDARTGAVLHVAMRRTDWIEDIHEGSWMGANIWLFLPVHVLSLVLWLSGVVMSVRDSVRRSAKPRARSSDAVTSSQAQSS